MRGGKPMPESLRRELNQDPDQREAPTAFTAAELMEMDFGAVKWAVPRILPEGVTILGGKPKMGKSWMALGLGIAIASGGVALGKVPVEQGDVLYLALEDNPRRLQGRLRKLLAGAPAPQSLVLDTEAPRVGEGLEAKLEGWLKEHPDAKLVIIDTLKRIRPHTAGNRNVYDVDYEALAPLLSIASRHGASVLVVHHLRKSIADDPLDELSSSTGLTAVVDGALILKRDRGKADAYLHVTGRDIEDDQELALRFDKELASWTLEGDAEEFRRSAEQQRIIELLRSTGEPIGPKDIAEALELPHGSVRVLLPRMVREGLLENPAYGKYTAPSEILINTLNSINTPNSVNSGSRESGKSGSVNAVNGGLGDDETPEGPFYRPNSPSVAGVNAVNGGDETASKHQRLTTEEAQEVQRLISEGVSVAFAREEVLGRREEHE